MGFVVRYLVLGREPRRVNGSWWVQEHIFRRMYPDLVKAFENRTCPFCGRRFRLRRTLWVHLRRRRKCRELLDIVVEDVREAYIKYAETGGGTKKRVHEAVDKVHALDEVLDRLGVPRNQPLLKTYWPPRWVLGRWAEVRI